MVSSPERQRRYEEAEFEGLQVGQEVRLQVRGVIHRGIVEAVIAGTSVKLDSFYRPFTRGEVSRVTVKR